MEYFRKGLTSEEVESPQEEFLDEIYAGAFGGGFLAMLVDEDAVHHAGPKELEEIARRYGLR